MMWIPCLICVFLSSSDKWMEILVKLPTEFNVSSMKEHWTGFVSATSGEIPETLHGFTRPAHSMFDEMISNWIEKSVRDTEALRSAKWKKSWQKNQLEARNRKCGMWGKCDLSALLGQECSRSRAGCIILIQRHWWYIWVCKCWVHGGNGEITNQCAMESLRSLAQLIQAKNRCASRSTIWDMIVW